MGERRWQEDRRGGRGEAGEARGLRGAGQASSDGKRTGVAAGVKWAKRAGWGVQGR